MTKLSYIYLPNAGDIIWLELNPRTGHEQSGRRPCLVLSEHMFSARTGMAIVCPITSNIRGIPSEIKLTGTKTKGAILPIYIRSVDLTARYAKFVENVSPELLMLVRGYVATLTGYMD